MAIGLNMYLRNLVRKYNLFFLIFMRKERKSLLFIIYLIDLCLLDEIFIR